MVYSGEDQLWFYLFLAVVTALTESLQEIFNIVTLLAPCLNVHQYIG